MNLGLILPEGGESAAPAGHLDRAIQAFGHTADAAYPHYLRAKTYTEENRIDKAAEQLQEAVTLRPDFAEAWSDLGQARKVLLDGPGALAAFSRAVQLNPRDDIAQYRLGAEYLDEGKPHDAVEHLELACSLKPRNQSTLNSLQRALREDGRKCRGKEIRRARTH
ncbi:MAG: tetratricopeptide repeat protein [Bryobacteraceae bacterium]